MGYLLGISKGQRWGITMHRKGLPVGNTMGLPDSRRAPDVRRGKHHGVVVMAQRFRGGDPGLKWLAGLLEEWKWP